MKRVSIILLSVLAIVAMGNAQNERFDISLHGGLAIPIGSWGEQEIQGQNSSIWVPNGTTFGLSFNYKITKGNFGLTAMVMQQTNALDTESLARSFNRQNSFSNISVASGNFKLNQFLIGISDYYPIADKLSLDIKCLFGAMDIGKPALTITDENGSQTYTGSSSLSFVYLVGTGVRYHANSNLDFLFSVDFIDTNPYFGEFEYWWDIEPETNSTSAIDSSISSLNIKLGVAFKF
ncbi:MAG: hypothetical protein AB8G86_29315 [Saprospiraceae bacterium]